MPNPPTNVELHVKTGAPPDDTWKTCTGSDPEGEFCCKYTGGDWPADDPAPPGGGPGYFQAKTGQGAKTVHLSLVVDDIWHENNPNSHGFRITDLIYDPDGELDMVGNAPHERQIIDKASVDVPDGTYTIVVAFKDGVDGPETHNIQCDPGWRNR